MVVLSLSPDDLDHVEEAVLLKEQGLEASLEVTCTKAVCPAKLVDIRLFVEVIAVLADVVQLSVNGRVIFPPALVRNPSIPLEIESSPIPLLERPYNRLVLWVLCQKAQLQEAGLLVEAADEGDEDEDENQDERVHRHPTPAPPPPA